MADCYRNMIFHKSVRNRELVYRTDYMSPLPLTRASFALPLPVYGVRRRVILKEPLIKSSTDCVAGKMRMDARRATKVVAGTTTPRSATTQTQHFSATRRDRACPGGLLCHSACQGEWPLAAPRFAHPIPESRRRNRVGLNQRFLKQTV